MEQGRLINRQEIIDKIDVREPYFALKNLQQFPSGAVSAIVPVEQPFGMEAPPITAAEAGRHLAILGSCVSALNNPNPGRCFYLAHQATLTRVNCEEKYYTACDLIASAEGNLVNKRTAIARCELSTADGVLLYTLEIRYHVIAEAVFEKLYHDRRVDLRREDRTETSISEEELRKAIARRVNPYLTTLPLYESEVTEKSFKTSLGQVSAEHCRGHFPFYPALSVSFLVSTLSSVAGQLLRYRLQSKGYFQYAVEKVVVQADNLAFAGDDVTVEAQFVQSEHKTHMFRCLAYANKRKVVGDVIVVLVEL